jgi:hypothetical protein
MGISKRPSGVRALEFGMAFRPESAGGSCDTEGASVSPAVLTREPDVPAGPLEGLSVEVLNRRKAARAAASLGVEGLSLSLDVAEEELSDGIEGKGGVFD